MTDELCDICTSKIIELRRDRDYIIQLPKEFEDRQVKRLMDAFGRFNKGVKRRFFFFKDEIELVVPDDD